VVAAAGNAVRPALATGVEAFATSPTAAKTGGAIARTAVTLGALAQGVKNGNLTEALASPIAGWQAGKGGYWLTQHAQSLARPVATLLENAAPVTNAVTGVLGAVDLAQMAHENLPGHGLIGPNLPPMSDEQAISVLEKSVAQGANPASVAAMLAKGDPQKFGELLTAYAKRRETPIATALAKK
jgi:TPR repeat protein